MQEAVKDFPVDTILQPFCFGNESNLGRQVLITVAVYGCSDIVFSLYKLLMEEISLAVLERKRRYSLHAGDLRIGKITNSDLSCFLGLIFEIGKRPDRVCARTSRRKAASAPNNSPGSAPPRRRTPCMPPCLGDETDDGRRTTDDGRPTTGVSYET